MQEVQKIKKEYINYEQIDPEYKEDDKGFLVPFNMTFDQKQYKQIKLLGYKLSLMIAQDILDYEYCIKQLKKKFPFQEYRIIHLTIDYPNDILITQLMDLDKETYYSNNKNTKVTNNISFEADYIKEHEKKYYNLKTLIKIEEIYNLIKKIEHIQIKNIKDYRNNNSNKIKRLSNENLTIYKLKQNFYNKS